MKLLILGGTRFLGRHLAEAAVAAGHDLTLFHRGRTNPGVIPGTGEILGDRDGGLGVLRGHSWDAVIDTCGYVPRVVRQSVAEIEAGLYVFASTISVYADYGVLGITEESPRKQPPPEEERTEEVTPETYGWLKALCEDEMPERSLVVRPCILAGPHDYTDRFTWWLRQVEKGGEVVAPGRPGRPVQVLDVRDLAVWLLGMVERGRTGIFNTTGPDRPLTMGEMLETLRRATGSDATFVWREPEPDAEIPFWIPEEKNGFHTIDSRKARAEGLVCRPLLRTALDTLDSV
ncbi:MAG TPA: NAD-dependent epimerase/dehydratase family protein [Thermoanaerobaculia bacterium]|jgi:2'-hydroxyisoflavone reductase|nr:NAD-dependent epimerase/dehydratase family protein [Thermoanaerobaculia bacterium]